MKKAILILALALALPAAAQVTPSYLPAKGGTVTGGVDGMIYNPFRSGATLTNAKTGKFDNFFLTGSIPGTAAYNYGQVSHYQRLTYFQDTTPGCWGFAGSCYNTQHSVNPENLYINGGGGTNVNGMTADFFSVGDHIGYENYINSFGGSIDGGGPEGTKGMSLFVSEPADTWTGTVATGHGGGGQTTITATCSTDCGSGTYGIGSTPGVSYGNPASLGQGLIVTDEHSALASGQVMSVTNSSGNTPGTMTVNISSGLSNLAVSTCEATLTSTLSPVDNPSGSGSQALTFTVNDVSGSCTAGGLISFTGSNHEQALITSATTPSGGQQSITANVRLYHVSGSYIFENPNSDAGLFADLVANHTGSLSFPFDVVGVQSISGNTVVFWYVQFYAGSGPGGQGGFPYGRMNLAAIPVKSLSNTSNTVTFTLNQGGQYSYGQPFVNAPAIYLSSADNATFDGPCTGVSLNLATSIGTCTQAASSGQTATSATMTLTDSTDDNPYGNSRVNFYQGAAIVDPQDWSAPVVVNGVSNPVVDGKQFTVEPNEMALAAGDALVEHHSAAQFRNTNNSLTVQNPVCYLCYGIDISLSGVNGASSGAWFDDYAFAGSNSTPFSNYQYFGGTMQPVDWGVIYGAWSNFLDAQYPPAPGGAAINVRGCPPSPSSCTDAGYYYNLYNFTGNGSSSAQYYPATNTIHWNGAQQYLGAVSLFDGVQLIHSGNEAKFSIWEGSYSCGLGSSYFCVDDSHHAYTYNNTLDDGTGNANIAKEVTAQSLAVNGGHQFTRHNIITASLTPVSVAANTCAAQTLTVTGVNSGDHVINRDIQPSFTGGLGLNGVLVTGANTVSMNWCNNTAGALTPVSGTYTFDVEQ